MAKAIFAVLLPAMVFAAALASEFLDPWLVIMIGIIVAAIVAMVVIKLMQGGR